MVTAAADTYTAGVATAARKIGATMADDLCPECERAPVPISRRDRDSLGAMGLWESVCPNCHRVKFRDGTWMLLSNAGFDRDRFIANLCNQSFAVVENRTDLAEVLRALRECFKGDDRPGWLIQARPVLERAWRTAERLRDDVPARPSILMTRPLATPVHTDEEVQVLEAFGELLRWCTEGTPADAEVDGGRRPDGNGKKINELVEAALIGKPFLLARFRLLAKSESPTKFRTISAAADCWKSENPDVARGLKSLRDELNLISGAPTLVISEKNKIAVLEWPE